MLQWAREFSERLESVWPSRGNMKARSNNRVTTAGSGSVHTSAPAGGGSTHGENIFRRLLLQKAQWRHASNGLVAEWPFVPQLVRPCQVSAQHPARIAGFFSDGDLKSKLALNERL